MLSELLLHGGLRQRLPILIDAEYNKQIICNKHSLILEVYPTFCQTNQ